MKRAIRPGTQLTAGPWDPVCRVGLIVEDVESAKYALTAKHIISARPNQSLYEKVSGVNLGFGHRFPSDVDPLSPDVSQPFYSSIGAVKLDLNKKPDVDNGHIIGTTAAKSVLGSRLIKCDGSKTPSYCTLVGVGGEILFEDPYSGSQQLFDDLVIVSFDFDSAVQAGDAGSLLATEDGLAVAVLISAGDRYYAAPILPYLERFSLKLIESPPEVSDSSAGAQKSISEQVELGVKALAVAIASEPEYHKDPRGQNVPHHLLKLLEDA